MLVKWWASAHARVSSDNGKRVASKAGTHVYRQRCFGRTSVDITSVAGVWGNPKHDDRSI